MNKLTRPTNKYAKPILNPKAGLVLAHEKRYLTEGVSKK